MEGVTLWIVGQYKGGEFPNIAWELAGVYDSEEKAVAACLDYTMFLWSMQLNETAPRETTVVPDFRYPIQHE